MPRGNGELILVVDDEAAVRQITQQTLEAFGYRVIAGRGRRRGAGLLRPAQAAKSPSC